MNIKKIPVLLSLCFASAACSYAPMYKSTAGFQGQFSEVAVGSVQIQGVERNVGSRRMPQRLSQKLSNAFSSEGARYTLNVSLSEYTNALATSRTASDERYQLQVVAHIDLLDLNSESLLKTKLSQVVAYNVQATGFATDSEESSAQERAIDRLAEDIIQQVHFKMYAMERE
jgi:hypothetical protein